MSEIAQVFHCVGGVSGTTPGEVQLPLEIAQVNLGSAAFVTFPIQRVDRMVLADSTQGSGLSWPLLTAITGSGTAQSINVSDTSFFNTTIVTYLIFEPGTANQEVCAVSITDATHVLGKVFNNHALYSPIKMIFSVYTDYIYINHVGSSYSLTNIGFIRRDALPLNCYDQYRLLGVVGTVDYEPDNYTPWYSGSAENPTSPSLHAVPQYDSGSLSGTGNPTNSVVLAAGPITSTTSYKNAQVQRLCTVTPEVDIRNTYAAYWDH